MHARRFIIITTTMSRRPVALVRSNDLDVNHARCVAMSPSYVVSGSQDHMAYVWRRDGDRRRRRRPAMAEIMVGSEVLSIAVSEMSTTDRLNVVVVTGSRDGYARVWNVETASLIRAYRHEDHVKGVSLCGLWLATASSFVARTFLITGIDSLAVNTFRGHDSWIQSIVMTNTHVCTGSWDRTVKLWNRKTGSCERTWLHGERVNDVALTESMVASASRERIKVWSRKQGALVHHFTSLLADRICLTSNCLVVGSQETRRVLAWNTTRDQKMMERDLGQATLPSSKMLQLSVAVAEDMFTLVVASTGEGVRLWDTRSLLHPHFVNIRTYARLTCLAAAKRARCMYSDDVDTPPTLLVFLSRHPYLAARTYEFAFGSLYSRMEAAYHNALCSSSVAQ